MNSLNEVKNFIYQAMQLDQNNNNSIEIRLLIYQKYVKSIKDIFTILDEDLNTHSFENKVETMKHIRNNHLSILTTAQHCCRRVTEQIADEDENKLKSQISNSLDKKRNPSLSRSMSPMSSIESLLTERPVNPIDSAKSNIQKLIKSTNKLLESGRLSVSEKASLQLRISREIEHNLSIARKHENQMYQTNVNNLEILLTKISEDINRFGFFKNNPDFPILYRSSQLFYYHILKDSRTYSFVKSTHSPEVSCLSFILKMNNVHPVVDFISKLVEKLLNFSFNKENQNAFMDELKVWNDTIEDLSKLCCLVINANSSDQISTIYPKLQNVLLEYIFKNIKICPFIYQFLFIAYDEELKQYDRNLKFIEENNKYENLLPDKFLTQPEVIMILDDQTSQFSKLRNIYNPLEKLESLCQIITDLMSKIQNQNASLEIGADELVPILVYMIIKCNSAEIFLHGKYLEHLIPSSYLIGIEGYILISLICALTFCVSSNFISHITKT